MHGIMGFLPFHPIDSITISSLEMTLTLNKGAKQSIKQTKYSFLYNINNTHSFLLISTCKNEKLIIRTGDATTAAEKKMV